MLTSACRYGVLAMIHLARNVDAGFIPVRQIGNDLDVSNPFLSKIMQQLVAHDLVVSLRGPTGGVKLSKSASSIVLNDIVEAIDGRKMLESCVLGLPGCGSNAPCPLHETWKSVRTDFCQMLENTTVATLAKNTDEQGLRLVPG